MKTFSLFFILLLIGLGSCNDPDHCELIVCENDGTCVSGGCNCLEGYTGSNCENFDINFIQQLLDTEKHSPLEFVQNGIPVDSLYGKIYKDGLIFYIDVDDEYEGLEGIVAAQTDQSMNAQWGCHGQNILQVNDTENYYHEFGANNEEGARIGNAKINTDAIITECPETYIAAYLCRALGEEWSLPTMDELYHMCNNLHGNNFMHAEKYYYWSSTERYGALAFYFLLDDCYQWGARLKEGELHVRAVKYF